MTPENTKPETTNKKRFGGLGFVVSFFVFS
jgi:hypothetical protein